jgi:hypothetical protein
MPVAYVTDQERENMGHQLDIALTRGAVDSDVTSPDCPLNPPSLAEIFEDAVAHATSHRPGSIRSTGPRIRGCGHE